MAERKTEKLTEAAEKTTAVLQGLQSRLSREAGARSAQPEIPDELGKQLEEYFASASLPSAADQAPSARLDEIRSRVMEGVVERILRGWQEPGGRLSAAFKDALVERLIERVLDSLQSQKE
jgi:uncharacterized protein (DUF2267 family)